MNRMLRSFLAIIVAGLFVASSTNASADPADERVLVLAVSKGRGSDARLVKALSEHLQRSGMTLTGESLSSSDRACESSECIEALATRESAQLILTAQLQENAPNTVFITMALFDAVRKAPFQATALCDQCDQEALIGKLSDVADKLIKQSRDARQNPVHTTLPPNVPTVPLLSAGPGATSNPGNSSVAQPTQAKKGSVAQLPLSRKIIAGALGAAALGVAVQSIIWAVNDGKYCNDDQSNMSILIDGKPSFCRFDNKTAYGAGFAITGGLVIGLGLTLFLPESTKQQRGKE